MNTQVASDLLELADLCGWHKKQFADIADFILNRVLLVAQGPGVQRLRTADELRPYILQLEQAGGLLQPLSREDTYQAFLPQCEDAYLIDQLLGREGVADKFGAIEAKCQQDAALDLNQVRIK